jgi:uncharacterized protein YjiS (DUF1127 family)
METVMSAKIPVLPIPIAVLVRAIMAGTVGLVRWLRHIARVRRNRREASSLCGLDNRVLRDIGITRSDLRDAFSEPFWEDPTALLRERALERRLSRVLSHPRKAAAVEKSFHRLAADRSPRLVG